VVVAVMPVLPGLLGLPPFRLKLTALPESVSVIESERTAFSAMGLAPEFRTCATNGAEIIDAARSSAATVPSFVRIRIGQFFLEID